MTPDSSTGALKPTAVLKLRSHFGLQRNSRMPRVVAQGAVEYVQLSLSAMAVSVARQGQ